MNRLFSVLTLVLISFTAVSQANFNVTDPERSFKEAKDFFIQEQYALAYPLLKDLKQKYPENTSSSHTYLNQDIEYYFIVCGLVLDHEVAEEQAKSFIAVANNEPRQQIMSYHLARFYFIRNDFENAVTYYERAGYDNLSNEEIANAKFELAYSYFNLKR